MKEQENTNPVIWITSDIEEWDGPDIEYLTYKGKEKKCFIRDVDVFDPNVANFKVGDYILENSNIIQIKSARLWKIILIFKPDKYHDTPDKCKRMLISECWKKIELESLGLYSIKNEI